MLKDWGLILVSFFGFSKRECRGIILLFVLIITTLFAPKVFHWFIPAPLVLDSGIHEELADYFSKKNTAIYDNTTPLQDFDPNTLSLAGWISLGFSTKQAQTIQNYLKKGGRFSDVKDLRKMYVISKEAYERIAPYVVIAEQSSRKSGENDQTQRLGATSSSQHSGIRNTKLQVLELNAADSIDLLLLPGIGPVFASRIIRFRNILGGFHRVSQLLKVYGMDSIRYNQLVDLVRVDSSLIQKISINEADYQELRSHPLIGNKLAGVLLRYRTHHGKFESLADLREKKLVEEEILLNIAPYLAFYY